MILRPACQKLFGQAAADGGQVDASLLEDGAIGDDARDAAALAGLAQVHDDEHRADEPQEQAQ